MPFHFTAKFVVSSVVTLTLCCLGLVGNILCAIVLFSTHMPRSSYVYILQGLAISDISLLTLSFIRTMGNLGCIQIPTDDYTATTIFFWDWISTSSTKYYTVAISVERFFVITFPFLAHSILTSKRSRATAFGIFGFCVALSLFSFAYNKWISSSSFHAYVAVVLHFVPFLLVLVFNFLVFLGLRRIHRRAVLKMTSGTTREDEYNITKMLFAIVLVFGICYSFEFVRRMMNYLWSDYMTSSPEYYDYTINCMADVFYVLNSSCNFIIYSLLGKNFRHVFCKTFGIARESESESLSNNLKESSQKNSACGGGGISSGAPSGDGSHP